MSLAPTFRLHELPRLCLLLSRFLSFAVGVASVGRSQVVYNGDYSLPPNVIIGDAGIGSLAITNGGLVSSNNAIIGNLAGSSGRATIDGIGSTWTTNTYALTVGSGGTGLLAIKNGGSVFDGNGYIGTGNSGTATVNGSGSTWGNSGPLAVGYGGDGSLAITNGGSVTNTYVLIGYGNSSSGRAIIDGIGSTWTTNTYALTVGDSEGDGSLAIRNGGSISDGNGTIGNGIGSSGTVSVKGDGSTWANSGPLSVGSGGAGSLAITNGGGVTSTYSFVGSGVGSSGMVTVNGTGSSWTNSNNLNVGYSGSTGSLTITNGGVVSAAGTFTNSGNVSIGSDSTLSAGAYTQTMGSTLLKNGTLDPAAIDILGGVFGGTGTVIGNLAITDASLDVGHRSPGQLATDGDFTQAGGEIGFDIYSNGSGGFLESTLGLTPGASIGIDDATIIFNFIGGANPLAFFNEGSFGLDTFFQMGDGSLFSSDYDLSAILQGDTFTIGTPGYTVVGFDASDGALQLAQTGNVPETPSSALLLVLGIEVLFVVPFRRGEKIR